MQPEYPVIVISLAGGLLSVETKDPGCVLILHDYDAMDTEQDSDDLEENYESGQVETNEQGEEYLRTVYAAADTVQHG